MQDTTVGVLALQGDFVLHAELLKELGVVVTMVRRATELEGLDALVMPGGESTTLRKLFDHAELVEPIRQFAADRPVLGTCAGCILLATDLEDSGGVEPLGLLDITVRRNGFGRQIDSFEASVELNNRDGSQTASDPVAFIRAPRITRVGEGVEVWSRYDGEVVAVRSGKIAALTFHPEVNGVRLWHQRWLEAAFHVA